jgi:hypothetical protein
MKILYSIINLAMGVEGNLLKDVTCCKKLK